MMGLNRYKLQVAVFLMLTVLASGSSVSRAAVRLGYQPNETSPKHIVLENDLVRYTLLFDRQVALAGLVDKATGKDLLAGSEPQLFANIGRPGSYQFSVSDSRSADGVTLTVTQHPQQNVNTIKVIQTFTLCESSELAWNIEVENISPQIEGEPIPWTTVGTDASSGVSFPVMQQMVLGSEEQTHCLLAAPSAYYFYFYIDDPDDYFLYWTERDDPRMPIDIFNTEAGHGVYFRLDSSEFDFLFSDKENFRSKSFYMTLTPGEKRDILDCRIVPHEGDWHAAFDEFKARVRAGFDFTYYERPVQQDYRRRPVKHFTFLYDHEIFDPETNGFRIDEFLDEGEQNFGGYDFLLLWHNYPRLGIDERDQFDIMDYLPGGLEGVRKMVDRAHQRGVKVFFSYNPWDIMDPDKDHARECARVIKAIGADGHYLDTMKDLGTDYRQALDEINEDIILMTEKRPDIKAAEMITGSWQERPVTNNTLPNIDLLRFVLPEHIVYNTCRSLRQRENLVLNALFNGNGLTIWEDNFGDIALIPPHERITIHRYNRIIHENQDAFLTDNPMPLVKDYRDDVFVNAFPSAGKCIYTVYQDGRENAPWEGKRFLGPFMSVEHPDNWHFVDVWNHRAIPTKVINGTKVLSLPEEPDGPMSCILALPRVLRVENNGSSLNISLNDELENSAIQIKTVNNLTWMEEDRMELAGRGGTVEIRDLELDYPYLVLVKLMQDGILMDEAVVNLGWKSF
jgi:hypothetical protein